MHRFTHSLNAPMMVLLMSITGAAVAQPEQGTMADGGMMMSGWAMLAWVVLGVLLFIALILAILALLKYLIGKKT